MDLSSLAITYQKIIPKEYIDVMGHMNVMYYTHLFDEATDAFFNNFGLSEHYCRQNNNGYFALEAHVRYLAEARLGQGVSIHTRLLGYSKKTVHFMHFMRRDHDDQLAATVEYVGIHTDLQTRRSAPFLPEIVAQLEPIWQAHSQLDWEAPVCGVMSAR